MGASYFLSQHVHVCIAGNQVVLLDLERDKYLALARTQSLAAWVRGWPAPAGRAVSAAELVGSLEGENPENRLLARMISEGLVVTDPAQGKEASPVVMQQANATLVEFEMSVRPRVALGHLGNLAAAFAAAKWSLKYRHIKEVVRAAGARKGRVPSIEANIRTIRPLVAAFIYLRPLFYTVHNACLLDSLTLLHFLARYRVFPTWVFGVQTEPFYPHCWVQQGDIVFNDTPDRIRGYSPILVI